MASIDGALNKRTFFHPARSGIGRGFHLAAGEPVRLIGNPHTGAPIACLLRNGNEYLAAALAADVVGGWDPTAAEYGRQGE